jgi:predicted DNA-binding transcriptional regulator AlpA
MDNTPSPSAPQPAVPEVLDRQGVAALLGITTRSVDRLVKRGELPRPTYFGNRPRWLQLEILARFRRRPNRH